MKHNTQMSPVAISIKKENDTKAGILYIFLIQTIAVSLLLLAFQLKAHAQSPTAPALGFNIFVQNNAAFYTSQSEGAVAIGGDLTIAGGYEVATQNAFYYQSNGLNLGLLVGGKVNYNNGGLQVLNNGYVLIGNQNGSVAWYTDPNNATPPIRITPNSNYNDQTIIMLQASAPTLNVSATNNPVFQPNPINFASAFSTMQSSSAAISALSDNTVIYASPNQNAVAIPHSGIPSNSQIYIKNLVTGTNVLNITGADLNNIAIFAFNQQPDANHILVVNVNTSGTNGTFNWNAFQAASISGTNAQYILYNFYNTTQLNITAGAVVEGTVFAPFANITKSANNGSNIEGQVIGLSYSQAAGGVVRSFNFTSTINGLVASPLTGPSLPVFSNIGTNSLKFSCTAGNGSNRMVIASTAALTALPSNNTAYTANTVFGQGSAIGNGYVVYNGSGNSVTVSNLIPNTTYYFTVVEYNGTGSLLSYATTLTLSASQLTLADTDGDGVADIYDAYPLDPYKAFNNYYPAAAYSSLLFEDLWPAKGDYDFNDFAVDYNYNVVTNAQNNVVEVDYTFIPRAAGSVYQNQFGFQLDGILSSQITSVTGTKAPSVQTNSNGTEAGQTAGIANIIVSDNNFNLFNGRSGNQMVNTYDSLTKLTADTLFVSVKFMVNGVAPAGGTVSFNNFGSNVFNPYLIQAQNRGHEIHQANRIPSAKMDYTLFGTADDGSNPSKGIYFVTPTNLPWVLNIISSIPYPKEGTDITKAYLYLLPWATSGGATNTDWFLNITGYRNTANLYNQ